MIETIKKFLGEIDSARVRIEGGTSSGEDVPSPFGGSVRMSSGPDGATLMSFSESESAVVRMYNPGPGSRPADYPADLPFLPGVAVSLFEMPDERLRTLSWMKVTRAVELATQVAAQMTEAGWAAEPVRNQLLGLLGSETEFLRGGTARRLIVHRFPGRPAGLRLIEKATDRVVAERA